MNTDNPSGTTPKPTSETISFKQSRLIGKVLSPAVRLWLRSQVSQVSHLEVKISGSDRQILTGYIPHVSVSASNAVYQGLHLSQIQLVGENIRINLGQVLRGKPLRLLEIVPVVGKLLLQQADLNTSIESPLLVSAVTDLLKMLLPTSYLVNRQVSCQEITIDSGQIAIAANAATDNSKLTPIIIRSGLQLASCHELHLEQPQIQTQQGIELANLHTLKLDLGSEVDIHELSLTSGQLVCRGCINVMP